MSESEEMYLITIAQLIESGAPSPIPISNLAQSMGIRSVSANQMVHKLQADGLLSYTPYKGVALTPKGHGLAAGILRKRRLWEVFLVESLNLPAAQAETMSCQLEHVLDKGTSERLAEFLGQPRVSPQNKLIPEIDRADYETFDLPLSSLSTGESGEITRITAPSAARDFLAKHGYTPNSGLTISAAASDGERLVINNEGAALHISAELSNSIFVKQNS